MEGRVFAALAAALVIELGFGANATPSQPVTPATGQSRNREPALPPLPEGVRLVPNLEYGRAGGSALLLDLYLPPRGDGPAPILLWIHGGGWDEGDRHDRTAVPLTAHGYAVASIDYRLSGQATFPAQIEDCKAAVRWLRTNARRYGL